MLVVEVPEHPVGRVQVYVYGDVPPVVVAVHVKGTPAVPAAQLTLLVSGCPPTLTEVEPLCVTALVSLAALLIE